MSEVEANIRYGEHGLPHVGELALGGTAVGSGLHTQPEHARRVAEELATITPTPFVTAPNKIERSVTAPVFGQAQCS